MFWKAGRGARVAVLALAFLALGCEAPTEPRAAQPLEVESESRLLGGLLGSLGSALEIVEGTTSLLTEQVVTVLVDPAVGGVIELLGHRLEVPAGAVDDPTYFVMIALPGNAVRVELYAIDVASGLDVGANGFDVPVELTLSWAGLSGIKDPSRLVIAYLPPQGSPQQLPTTIDGTARTASADLDHFSRYALCRN